MGRIIDLTGQKFGFLTVIERDLEYQKEKNSSKSHWKCKCICGKIKTIEGNSLKTGKTKSCGCQRGDNLIGKKFNKLLVMELLPTRQNRNKVYRCLCDCGNYVEIAGRNLKNGHTKSCGCLAKEIKENNTINLVGKKFGNLTVLEKSGYKNKRLFWKCQCSCGNITYVSGACLRSEEILSCGCILSRGEERISKILTENNIPYIKQKTFKDCMNAEHSALLRFDFYINNEFLLEFDGQQHFSYTNYGWNTEEHFKKVQENDLIKNNFAQKNNIPLKRIPYWKLKGLTLEDILGEKYLIK